MIMNLNWSMQNQDLRQSNHEPEPKHEKPWDLKWHESRQTDKPTLSRGREDLNAQKGNEESENTWGNGADTNEPDATGGAKLNTSKHKTFKLKQGKEHENG